MQRITLALRLINSIRIALAITIIIAMVSCSKGKNDIPAMQPQPVNKKLVGATYVYNNGTPERESFSYDGAGRLSSCTDDSRTYDFTYTNSSLLNVSRKTNGVEDQNIECTLNSNGAITKMIYKKPDGVIFYTKEYTYDVNGYVLTEKGAYTGGYTYEEDYVIENGNAVSSKLYYDGVLYNSRFYYYDLARTNKGPFNHSQLWASTHLFGKPSKNIQTEYKDYDKNGLLIWHSKQTTVLDADGFIKKRTTDFILQGTQSIADYIFQ